MLLRKCETMSDSVKVKLRDVRFRKLEDAVKEAEQLLVSGYIQHGKWTLGQICCHCREVQEFSLHGSPRWMSLFAFVRPLYRKALLPRLLRGESPIGMPTAPALVPAPNLDDQFEVEAFASSVDQLMHHPGEYFPHPGFGQLGREGLLELYTAHASHHFRFLEPCSAHRPEV